jgi:hypothetical protein
MVLMSRWSSRLSGLSDRPNSVSFSNTSALIRPLALLKARSSTDSLYTGIRSDFPLTINFSWGNRPLPPAESSCSFRCARIIFLRAGSWGIVVGIGIS